MLAAMEVPPQVSLETLIAGKRSGRKFAVLTCYDARMAAIMEAAGIEVLLVGDTAGEVVLGLEHTRDISPEVLLELTAAVRRGAPQSFVMADLPYACLSGGADAAVDWAVRFHRQPCTDGVKVEVTLNDAPLVEAMTAKGVPVVAHLGLRPPSVPRGQAYRAVGREAGPALCLLEEARVMEQAGAAMLLVEAVPSELAGEITRRAAVPVIGCVAGPHCDGTVVVLHDMLGLGGGHPPRQVKRYADLSATLLTAFSDYGRDIREGRFPVEVDAIHMRPGELEKLLADGGQ